MKEKTKDALQVLRTMVFSKSINETVRRAVRVRLQAILEEEEKSYERWKDVVSHKLNLSRQKQVAREFKKRIQAMKIVVHYLTPFCERMGDTPMFIVRKPKKIVIKNMPIQKMIELVPEKVIRRDVY